MRLFRTPGYGLTCVCLLVLAAWLALSTPQASASVIYEEVGHFTAESLFLTSVSVDNSGGANNSDIYVAEVTYNETAEQYESAIARFSPSGTLQCKITGQATPASNECNGVAGSETPQGGFGLVSFATLAGSGVAVDNSTSTNKGDLYVADIQNDVVDKFGGKGEFLCQITGTATPSAKECNGATGSETKAGGFEPTAVAVNSSGDLYIADHAHNVIDEFGPKGEYIEAGEISGPAIVEPTALALGPGGTLYIVNGGGVFSGGNDVVQYSGGKFTVIESNEPHGIAVNSTTGHLYAQDNGNGPARVDDYNASGTQIGTFGEELGELATSSANGDIYYALAFSSKVLIFGPGIVVPTVSVAAATNVEETTATVNGEVSPDTAAGGTEVTECHFEYVTQAQFEVSGFAKNVTTVGCSPATPYTVATSVSANVAGLVASTTYRYRLAASNANGHVSYSEGPAEETFTTKGPPTIEEESVSNVRRTTVTFEAKVNPKGYDTHYFFEYGETTSYGTNTPVSPADIGSGEAGVAITQVVNGLKVGTTYHYRLVAVNARATERGADETVSTVPVAAVQYQAAVAGPHTAVIKANVDPYGSVEKIGASTSCGLQYVAEAEYASNGYTNAASVPCDPATVEESSNGQNEIVRLTGLSDNTTYHYRFVVRNPAGEAYAAESVLATFGVESFTATTTNEQGTAYYQAGGHPYQLTTSIDLNAATSAVGYQEPSGRIRDIEVELPPGLIGNPNVAAKCAQSDAERDMCPSGSQVGTMNITLSEESRGAGSTHVAEVPLFNLVPPNGVAAEFATSLIEGQAVAYIDATVRTGQDYGVTAGSLNIATIGEVRAVTVTMWGVPADPGHDLQRVCLESRAGENGAIVGRYKADCQSSEPLTPFLRDPTSCEQTLSAVAHVDSYNAPGEFVTTQENMPAMQGCEKVPFGPSIAVMPEVSSGASTTALRVDLRVPQNENPVGLAQADVKDATVTLPQGISVNPSVASGLVGCTEAQIELHGPEPAKCPNASKVGSVEINSPLVDHPLKGGVYVAQQGNGGPAQGSNPFGSLTAIYVAVDDPETGVVIKLAGKVTIDQTTGQITTTFDENPQLPFEDLRLELFGGSHAALATPPACGVYKMTTLLEPWSHQGAPGEAGTPDAKPYSEFDITSGSDGAPCSSLGGFAPGLVAGTQSNAAASFSPFVMNLTRKDGEQVFSTVALTMPGGLAGDVSTVTLCPEAQANAGMCPASSKIGHVRISAGVGKEPIVLPEAGKAEDPVYLTGPYDGAPFGLAVVVPAEAGPFNLDENGHPIVVRAKIEIDPHTAQVTVVSDPQPTRLQGIPLDLRDIEVTVDKPGFMFNPTDCAPMRVNGTIGSAEGAAASVSSSFQAADCAALPFKLAFSALTNATHTRFGGDSLHVVVKSAQGQADLREVRVELPKVLPSRLSTLNQACLEATFAANPAACPKASRVGTVTVQTPLLPVPLVGPAYFVSHGGAKFPELIFVLQGDGVTVQLNGETYISEAGITSSTFKTLPDVPVSRVNVVLPAGQDSVLTGEGDLCAQPLYMPTTLVGHNGAVIKERVRIGVEGCKPELVVLRQKVKGATATITVKTPTAGKLVASGKFVSRAVKRLGKAGVATLSVTLTKVEQKLLALHRGRRLKVHVDLRLTHVHGHVLNASVTVLVR